MTEEKAKLAKEAYEEIWTARGEKQRIMDALSDFPFSLLSNEKYREIIKIADEDMGRRISDAEQKLESL